MVGLPLRLRAIFRDGKFVPSEPCHLPEASEVELVVENPHVTPPTITDAVERARVMEELIQRMKANPLPADAPRFSRDELHERR